MNRSISKSPERQNRHNNIASRYATMIALTCFFLMMTGCVNFPVIINDDPFKGVTVVSVDMWHTVLDSQLDNVRTSYYKEIARGEMTDPVVTIVFVATVDPYYYHYHGENLNRDAYIMVDSVRFPVNLFEINNVRVKHNSMIYNYPFFGYPHFFYYYPGVMIVRETNRRMLTAKIRLTPDIQKALAGALSYRIRLYIVESPVTLEATRHQLDALKKFLIFGRPAPSPQVN